ncbi:hypothetical protein JOF53_007119 [Crossiella equi]|uniref:NACHT domain-containing protein n=1 Tax=Crossiella equi TaxID=130796 RepID=A0ABS5APS1_9PSEU|nr:NACHT domain-containing protein [Crossiella equi]MBP2478247.1 hypothetical protein [Crossiella equi]
MLKLGQAVATRAATEWLRRHRARKDRTATLAELAAEQLGGPLQVRKWDNFLSNLGLQVAERLEPLLLNRFPGLPENEVQAALDAAGDALAEVTLADELLLTGPDRLAAAVREACPAQARVAGLGEDGIRLYEVALDQSCRYLLEVVHHLPAFQPRALAEVLGRLATTTGQLDELLARIPRSTLHAPLGTGQDAEFTTAYLGHLQSSLDRLELLGLSMHEQPRLALSVAYLSLSVDGSRRDRWFDQGERGRVESALGSRTRTLVLGEAGSGKTTLLDWLAVTVARGHCTGQLADWNGCVPFPVRLRAGELPRPEHLVPHAWPARGGEMPQGWAHRRLDDGTALLLVDGVDEVPLERRGEVRAWLRELVETFPRIRVVITARPAAVDRKWLVLEGFSAVTLEPMGPEDVRQFIERWHTAAGQAQYLPCEPAEVPAARQRLLTQLDARPQLRGLASNPLLCALLCALNLDHVAELPRSRMELYERALAMLLDLRDTHRRIPGLLDLAQKRVLLRDLAWRLTLANRNQLPRGRALDHLAAKLPSMPGVEHPADRILTHLLERSGVLREPVPGEIDFVHRSFQEYLAASEATEQDHIETLVAQAHLDAWRDTVVMACGHAKRKQADTLLAGILARVDNEPRNARKLRLLAASCLETVREIGVEVFQRIDETIRERLVPPGNLRETVSLASIGHQLLRYLPADLVGLSDAAAEATIRAAALTGDSAALPRLAAYAADPRWRVQRELMRAWHYFNPERYAAEVLADAPLAGGVVTVSSTRMFPHVHRLRRCTSVQVNGLDERLASLHELDDLQLSGVFLRFEGGAVDLRPLAKHLDLTRIDLTGADWFDHPDALATLPKLTSLQLSQQVVWHDLSELAALSGLESLDLSGVEEDIDWSPLRELPHLEDLRFDGGGGATPLWLPQLRTLALRWCHDADWAEWVVRSFPGLDMIQLQHMRLGSLRPLTALPLRKLCVWAPRTPVDLRPFEDREIQFYLDRRGEYLGAGPNVTWE